MLEILSIGNAKDLCQLVLRLKYYYEEPYAGKPHVRFCEGHIVRCKSTRQIGV